VTTPRRFPLVRAGDVLRVPEPDYMYGVGPLTLRVTAVDAEANARPELEWVRLQGVELRWDGSEGMHREVQVRRTALRAPGAITRTNGTP
jgi:hypothetical protein